MRIIPAVLVLTVLTASASAQDSRIKPGAAAPASAAWLQTLSDRGEPSILQGEALPYVSMPISGIGARHFALGGNGLLCEAHPGGSPRNVSVTELVRTLTTERNDPTPRGAPPMEVVLAVSGGGDWQAQPLHASSFGRAFPIGSWDFPAVRGVQAKLQAFSPMIPLNLKDSALPAAMLEYTLTNTGQTPAQATLAVGMQNFVGLLVGPVEGVGNWSYGGNTNKASRTDVPGWTAIHMTRDPAMVPKEWPADIKAQLLAQKQGEKVLAQLPLSAAEGELVLAVSDASATYDCRLEDMGGITASLSATGSLQNKEQPQPSPAGQTANGALASTVTIAPGESRTITFVLAWYFPNDTPPHGIMYSNWFGQAGEVLGYVARNADRLSRQTHLFSQTLFEGTLPWWLLDAVSANMAILRTGTVYWSKSQGFNMFEGEYCGANNCSHVWGYAQTHAFLWPEIARDMRCTELEWNLSPAGAVPERPTIWRRGGTPAPLPPDPATPEKPGAVDGACAAVLSLYREHLHTRDDAFLRRMLPRAMRLLDNVAAFYDPDGDGVLDGEQYNTYDHDIVGPNTFVGSYWLAALRAAEEMALRVQDLEAAKRYRGWFEKGQAGYARLFNGEFYKPHGGPEAAGGCLADQLVGQWWAHVLGLGDVLPNAQVKTTLGTIYRYNFLTDWGLVKQGRPFAGPGEKGLILVSWPKGPPPARHFLNYHNECWTGVEYEVAASMIYEGMVEQGLAVAAGARQRYTCGLRNPFAEVEYGPYYARAMSSFSLLTAAQGYYYDGPAGLLRFAPRIAPKNHRSFFVTADGWGSFSQVLGESPAYASLDVRGGEVALRTMELGRGASSRPLAGAATVELNGRRISAEVSATADGLCLKFAPEVRIGAGQTLKVLFAATP